MRKNRGFTLIELVICTVLVGWLAWGVLTSISRWEQPRLTPEDLPLQKIAVFPSRMISIKEQEAQLQVSDGIQKIVVTAQVPTKDLLSFQADYQLLLLSDLSKGFYLCEAKVCKQLVLPYEEEAKIYKLNFRSQLDEKKELVDSFRELQRLQESFGKKDSFRMEKFMRTQFNDHDLTLIPLEGKYRTTMMDVRLTNVKGQVKPNNSSFFYGVVTQSGKKALCDIRSLESTDEAVLCYEVEGEQFVNVVNQGPSLEERRAALQAQWDYKGFLIDFYHRAKKEEQEANIFKS